LFRAVWVKKPNFVGEYQTRTICKFNTRPKLQLFFERIGSLLNDSFRRPRSQNQIIRLRPVTVMPARIHSMNGSMWKNQIVKEMSNALLMQLAMADRRYG